MSVSDELAVGVQHQRAGRLGEAEQVFRGIIARQPAHPETFLAVLALQLSPIDQRARLTSRHRRTRVMPARLHLTMQGDARWHSRPSTVRVHGSCASLHR